MDDLQPRRKMTVAQIFHLPGLYFGRDFATIDEFAIFIQTLGLRNGAYDLPEEEMMATLGFNEFVCRHLHGHFDGTWQYDLLAEYGDHSTAIEAAKILLLRFSAMLREKGVDRYEEVVKSAPAMERVNPNRRRVSPGGMPEELSTLIAEAITMHCPSFGGMKSGQFGNPAGERIPAKEGVAAPEKPIEGYKKFEEWLSLTDAHRSEVSQKWNVYDGEGLNLALMALARLVGATSYPVQAAHVGIYHGGVYLLHMTVSTGSSAGAEAAFVESHEGFPVIWFSPRNEWLGGFRMGHSA